MLLPRHGAQHFPRRESYSHRRVIEHIAPNFARPALVASGSAWPSTRDVGAPPALPTSTRTGLYRAACRHARRSTTKPRDAVHARTHGHLGERTRVSCTDGGSRSLLTYYSLLTTLHYSLTTLET